MSTLSAKTDIEQHLRECCEEILAWHPDFWTLADDLMKASIEF